ncbi:hypothetical protein J6590_073866 [Homalodisca vitripennis]|nr:hypothetical protein J6590_073866 [Homalodisca vitripennis]
MCHQRWQWRKCGKVLTAVLQMTYGAHVTWTVSCQSVIRKLIAGSVFVATAMTISRELIVSLRHYIE